MEHFCISKIHDMTRCAQQFTGIVFPSRPESNLPVHHDMTLAHMVPQGLSPARPSLSWSTVKQDTTVGTVVMFVVMVAAWLMFQLKYSGKLIVTVITWMLSR